MKSLWLSILAIILIAAVGSSIANGTMASFFDTEVSTQNYMCAGTRCLEISGGPAIIEHAWPCEWYEEEFVLLNTGSLDSVAYIHFPLIDDPDGLWKGIRNIEAGTLNGTVFDGTTHRIPVGIEPIGVGVATTEPELVAEEGGWHGNVLVAGLGTDTCNISDFIDVKVWYEDVLKVDGRLSDIACTTWELGPIPAYEELTTVKGGGWGSYFTYLNGGGEIKLSLVGGQMYSTGILTISSDSTNIYVEYDTTGTDWKLEQTQVYAGVKPPSQLAPGSFPYKEDPISPPRETSSYIIPLSEIGAVPGQQIYMAAHAVVTHPDLGTETAWAKGVFRKVRVAFHWDDIPEEYFNNEPWWPGADGFFPNTSPLNDWPTNAYMGDQCIFDIVFKLWQ
ncbi:MAG: hypothetical protein PHQ86_01670 [Dehalococcoidales bacterium]|nr:hypothetical protein [Dehalococcoidales bacterium]